MRGYRGRSPPALPPFRRGGCRSWFSMPFGMNSLHPKGWRGGVECGDNYSEKFCLGTSPMWKRWQPEQPGFVPPAFASRCPRGSWLGRALWVQVCPGSLRTEGGANIGKSLPGCRFGELWSHVQGSVAIVTGYFRSLRWWFIIAAREAAARRERQGGRDPWPWEVWRNWDVGVFLSFLLSLNPLSAFPPGNHTNPWVRAVMS